MTFIAAAPPCLVRGKEDLRDNITALLWYAPGGSILTCPSEVREVREATQVGRFPVTTSPYTGGGDRGSMTNSCSQICYWGQHCNPIVALYKGSIVAIISGTILVTNLLSHCCRTGNKVALKMQNVGELECNVMQTAR